MAAPTVPRSRSPNTQRESSAYSENANPDEDWTQISNLAERRRIQNRIAQRTYRKKLKARMAADQDTGSANSSPPGSTASTESRRPKKDRRHTTQSHKSGTGQSLGTQLGAQSSLQRSHSASNSYEFAGRHSPFEGADSDAEEPWLDEYQSPDLSTLNGFAFNSPPLGSNSYPAASCVPTAGYNSSQPTSYGISADPQATAGLGIFEGVPQYQPQQYPQANLSQYTTTATVGPSQVLYSHSIPVTSSGYSYTTSASTRPGEPAWRPSY